MPVAQGVSSTLARVKQSGLGVPGSAGSSLARRVTVSFNKDSETYSSSEIASHQQSTGATEGPSDVKGSMSIELSAGTYALEWANLLRRDFTVPFTALTSVGLTIAGAGPTYTVTRSTGDFLSGGVKAGMVVRLSVGSLNAANINKNLLVITATTTVLTVVPLNGVAMVAEGPISGCTVSAPGKSTYTPITGHTNDYFTWERWFPDVPRSELVSDVKVASAALSIPGSGLATADLSFAGLVRTHGASQVLTSPAAETTSQVLGAVQGRILVNGAVTTVTGLQIQIDGSISSGEAEIGSNARSDLQRGRVSVSGSFTAKFSAATLMTLRDNQTTVRLIASIADSGLAAAEFITFTLPALKIFSDEADDGEKEIVRTYNFVAQYNGAGGAAADSHQTICQIHDSLAP
jgi:hypothetical protein